MSHPATLRAVTVGGIPVRTAVTGFFGPRRAAPHPCHRIGGGPRRGDVRRSITIVGEPVPGGRRGDDRRRSGTGRWNDARAHRRNVLDLVGGWSKASLSSRVADAQ